MRGRVTPGAVDRDRGGAHQLRAGEPVQERRLADAGRAQQHDGAAGPQRLRRELVDADARHVRDRVDRHADRNALDLQHRVSDVVAQVGLGQHDDRLGTAVPSGGDVPLQPPEAEVVVEPREQEGGVDVRRQHLFVRAEAGAFADECTAARQDRRDRRLLDADPVADGRDRRTDLVLVVQPPGGARPQLAVGGPHLVGAAMLRGDACGNQVFFVQLLECGRPAGVPPELVQSRQNESPL